MNNGIKLDTWCCICNIEKGFLSPGCSRRRKKTHRKRRERKRKQEYRSELWPRKNQVILKWFDGDKLFLCESACGGLVRQALRWINFISEIEYLEALFYTSKPFVRVVRNLCINRKDLTILVKNATYLSVASKAFSSLIYFHYHEFCYNKPIFTISFSKINIKIELILWIWA